MKTTTRYNILATLTALLLFALPLMSQDAPLAGQGVITGRVISATDGTPLRDAVVSLEDGEATAKTDADGRYRLLVPVGTHELVIEKVGFTRSTIADLEIAEGQTLTRDSTLKADSKLLSAAAGATAGVIGGGLKVIEELVVMGRAMIEGSVASSLSEQQESSSVIEVIGSEEFSRLGDSTAADTLQRLTGLNVEEGKFVVIRGQPLRYTSTLFNGSQMPSLDPIQSVTPLDLFPSGVLSNIAVQKAYTAERPGSFGSGQIQLSTTGMAAEDFLEIKVGSAVNFQSIDEDPLEFNTGDDIWGGVNDILDIPAGVLAAQNAGTPIATLPAAERIALVQSFSDELAPGFMDTSGPDGSFSLTGGKRVDTAAGSYGMSVAFDYNQNVRTESEERRLIGPGPDNQFIAQDDSVINRTKFATGFGGLLALTGEWENHELKSNTFWVRDTVEQTEVNEGLFRPSDEDFLRKFLLEFEQRELFIQQFTGKHTFDAFDLGWRFLKSNANRELPDRREFALENTQQFSEENPTLDGSGSWFVANTPLDRRWNSVEEDTFTVGADLTIRLSELLFADAGFNLVLQGGVDRETRDRESDTRLFQFVANPADGNRFLPVEQLFSDARVASGEVSFSEAGAADDYTADVEIEGSYVQVDVEVPEMFRLVAGVRFEQAEFDIQTAQFAGAGGAIAVNSGFIRRDELPSLVGSWFISDEMQVRGGIARSLAYPTSVELSDTTFIDPDSNEQFLGNPDLGPVVIDSYDLRWEWYPSGSEALTVGFFYKDMEDPIERTGINRGGGNPPIVEFRNAEKGEVIGVEVNGRVELGRFRDMLGGPAWLEDVHLGGNIAYQDSEVTLPPGIETNPVRRMTGQPEILGNLEIGYTGVEHIVRIAFGYTSDRLINGGTNSLPDEFIEPRFTLGGKWSYNPDYLDALTVSLELENLLNDEIKRKQAGILTRNLTTGVTGSLSLKWRFD